MANVIQIENGVVTLMEQKVLRSVSLAAFRDRLSDSVGVRTPVLPPGCVLYASGGDKSCFLLEQEPAVRKVRYARREDEEGGGAWSIPLPWTYLLACFHKYALGGVHAFFAKARIAKAESQLHCCMLPNVEVNHTVCLGDFHYQVTSDRPSRVGELVRFFWESEFNDDLHGHYERRMPGRIRELTPEGAPWLEGWSKLSFEEALRLDWPPACTVSEAVDAAIS